MPLFQMDNLTIEIMDDGTIKTTTDAVSAANHSNAEGFLAHMARLAGGERKRARRGDVEHSHDHSHSHGDHDHEHH
jgi:hypothetical protein